ncbi:MAG: hypothetical protein ACE5I3_08530 [Phycisphaerae bacterium]
MVSDLILARKHAQHSSTSQTLIFDVAANRYRLVGMSDADHPAKEYEVRLAEEPYRAAIVSADFAAEKQVVFDGYGMCEGDPGFDPNADFNADGCVDLSDLAALLSNCGSGM